MTGVFFLILAEIGAGGGGGRGGGAINFAKEGGEIVIEVSLGVGVDVEESRRKRGGKR
jgi:hypothetical protein